MSPEPTPLERQLGDGLRALAGRATASADAAARIDVGLVDGQPHGVSRGAPDLADADLVPSPEDSGSRGRARRPVLAGVAVAALLAIVAVTVSSVQRRPGDRVLVPAGPQVSTPATVGGVAYLSGRRLYISDARGTVSAPVVGPTAGGRRRLATPQWSPDGRYLAYRSGPLGTPSEDLRVTLADGTHDRVVWRGPVYAFGWSGGDDLLAVTPRSGGLVAVDPKGVTRTLVPSPALVFSFAWSSQGTSLAYSVARRAPQPDEVRIVDAATGVSTHVAFGPGPDAGVVLGKWWPDDHGLLWWIDPSHSTALEEDGLMLQSVPLGGRPVDLITTDVYLPWLAWSPDGATLAVVTGGTRLPSEGKRLALCQPRQGMCTRLAQPSGTVTLDPAWSRDGSRVAFVRAAERGSGAGADLASWYPSRRLWTSAPDGSGAVEVAGAGPGVAAPVWLQPDVVGYSTAEGINVISPSSGQAINIASGLSGGSGAGPDALGKQPWGGLAVWRP